MKTNNFKRNSTVAKAVKLALLGAVSVTSSVAFSASNTVGSIYGQAKEGAVVEFKNNNTGLSRQVTIGESGRFTFRDLPPGTYTVTTSNGASREVKVVVGRGSSVYFTEGSDETITIMSTQSTAIDTSSVESTMVFDQDQIDLLPIGRSTTNIALLTPGTVPGDPTFGNLPSFGGSSVAENGYYIDGMDVTNLQTLLSFANLPFDAIAQTQVKTGGYGAEFGRSLGGVTNTITKSGTNEWKFGGAVYYTPEGLRGDRIDVVDRGQNDGTLSLYQSNNEYTSLKYNLSAGGPIIEDTLFMYTNIEFQDRDRETFGSTTSTKTNIDNPNGLLKLDWYITDDHILSGTYIQNQTDIDVIAYSNDVGGRYDGVHGTVASEYKQENGGEIFVVNYSGYLTDDLSVSLMYGEIEDKLANNIPRNPDPVGALCPRAFDTTGDRGWGARETIGCWNPAFAFVLDPEPEASKDERVSTKIDFEYTLDEHNIRFGYNEEEYTSFTLGTQYTGGVYYRYFESSDVTTRSINGVELPLGTQAVRVITSDVKSGSFLVENTAFYIEDSWNYSDNLMIYMGLRNETFANYAANGDVFVEADDLIAPRLGFSWNMNGDSTAKLYGTYGRYYIPIAGNTNVRATRQESSSQNYYIVTGGYDATGSPIGLGAEVGTGFVDNQVPDPRTIAVTDLEPMYQDELIIGYQTELNDDWTGGVKFIYRDVKNGMDDFCGHDGFYNWGLDNGYAMATEANDWVVPDGGFDTHNLQGCIMINPGKDISIYADTNGNGEVEVINVSNDYFNLPEYKRTYKGLEFTAEKAFDDGWYANISYVWSKSEGNIEGYVNSTLGQEDPGVTQDFDHFRFQEGSQGPLPNDRTHQFKAYGAYQANDEVTITANFNMSSGTPLSCNGYIPTDGMLIGDGSTAFDEPNFKRYGPSTFYCASESGTPELSNRGDYGRTNWRYELDMGVNYTPEWADGKLVLQLDIFNIFEFAKGISFNQTKDFAQGSPDVNPNFLAPTAFQAPRQVRLSARYNF